MRTITFTMEDALISPEGFMILSGAGLIDASVSVPVYQHMMVTTADVKATATDLVALVGKDRPELKDANGEYCIYVMIKQGDEIRSEPFIASEIGYATEAAPTFTTIPAVPVKGETGHESESDEDYAARVEAYETAWATTTQESGFSYAVKVVAGNIYHANQTAATAYTIDSLDGVTTVLVDFYTAKTSSARQIEITADKFGGNYYLEASTLFRDTNGSDLPAEFIIPNCKVQSNFTFTMASSGDPSSFTFTMDAFPDYTRWDNTKKVLAAIQIIDSGATSGIVRNKTAHDIGHNVWFED